MSADSAKLIERAEKLLEKGKPELALQDFRAAIELQPANNVELMERVADLGMTVGQLGVATDLLRRLFSHYIDARQLTSAAGAFRKLQRLKALDPEMVTQYAELCESTSRKDAAEAYRIAFHEFQRLGDARRALACITKSLELDPRLDDYREQARIAGALHERVLAAEALVNLGVMQERIGHDPSEAYEQAFASDPNNRAARLGHGRCLLRMDRAAEALELLQPLATYPSSPEEAREPYALSLLAVGRIEEAEPYVWPLFERNPTGNLGMIHRVISGLLESDRTDKAIALARRLEEFFRKAGRRHEFMQDIARLAERCSASVAFFEYLAEIYNSANCESEYAMVLARLFDLYFQAGNHARALDALDRAVEIDPYEAGHKERMEKLAGKVPEERLQLVARRIGVAAPEPLSANRDEDDEDDVTRGEPAAFDDLLLQAEIYLQYGMRDKAVQQIELLKSRFPAETVADPRMRELLINSGLPVPAIATQSETASRKGASDPMTRAAEVGRLIARQGDPRSVMVTAVNQIGMRWQYDRCLAALATPGKAPSLVVEYCSPEIPRSERAAMVRLLALAQRLTADDPVFRAADVALSEPLTPIRRDLAKLNVSSLVIVALQADEQPIGLIIVQQCGVRRRWSNDDLAVLRSMADNVAQAVHGTRLRALVSTLGVAEEDTGLLKKSAYMDAVVGELRRRSGGAAGNRTLALLQAVSLTSENSDQAVNELVRTLRSIAQDQAMTFRYDRDIVALLLPRTGAAETETLVLKLREELEPIAVTVGAGIAEAAQPDGSSPEDAATEWVNRASRALVLAASIPDRICNLPPAPGFPAEP
jgi:tetratricopeptide (TPR) repeat protein